MCIDVYVWCVYASSSSYDTLCIMVSQNVSHLGTWFVFNVVIIVKCGLC